MIGQHAVIPYADSKYFVEALLVPPGSRDEGLAIGVDSEGDRIVGWGNRVTVDARPTRTLSVPHRDCVACALTIPSAALAAISATAIGRAEVEASGILGDLARHYLSQLPASASGRDPDLIVISGDDPATWQAAMGRLRTEGTLVALIGPHVDASEFDFYPQVHSRSLNLVPLAWYLPPISPQGEFSEWHDAAARVSQHLLAPSRNSSGWIWLTESDSNDNKPPTGD